MKKPPASKFLVLSGVGPMEDWTPGDVVVDPANTREEVREITIRSEANGAETVLVFEWDGEAWGLVPGEET